MWWWWFSHFRYTAFMWTNSWSIQNKWVFLIITCTHMYTLKECVCTFIDLFPLHALSTAILFTAERLWRWAISVSFLYPRYSAVSKWMCVISITRTNTHEETKKKKSLKRIFIWLKTKRATLPQSNHPYTHTRTHFLNHLQMQEIT